MSAIIFGKLPAHGDFVTRGVAGTQRVQLDDWLTRSLMDVRATLGDAFDDRFDQARPWRAEGDGVVGAIAASRDGAGRRFPLLLLTGSGTTETCEDLLYRAIAEDWNIEDLVAAAGPAPRGVVDHWYGDTGNGRIGAMPTDLLAAMLA